jgi:uncharacterized repeat protein (TIGR03987 family)
MRPSELLFIIAMVLYTVAIISNRVIGYIRFWMLVTFAVALCCDGVGTWAVCYTANNWVWNFHTISGAVALAVMAIHTFLGWLAYGGDDRKFSRYSIIAWLIWLASFASGVPGDFTHQLLAGVIGLSVGFCVFLATLLLVPESKRRLRY